MVKNTHASAVDTGDVGSIPGLGRSPGGGNGNPLQYPCLGLPMERGAWQAAFYVCKGSNMTEHPCICILNAVVTTTMARVMRYI